MIFEAPNAAHATPNWIFPDAVAGQHKRERKKEKSEEPVAE